MPPVLVTQTEEIERISKRVDILSLLVEAFTATQVFTRDVTALWLNSRGMRLSIKQYCRKLTALLDNESIIDPEDKVSDDLLRLQQQIKAAVRDIESIKSNADFLWLSVFLFNRTLRNLSAAHFFLGKMRIALMEHDADFEDEGPVYSNAEDLIADLHK
jgi:hypothetical protein